MVFRLYTYILLKNHSNIVYIFISKNITAKTNTESF